MPTYQYRCTNCNHTLEEFQKMSDEPLTECPSCKTKNLVRVIGVGGGMIFKGSGFYLTDYKNAPSTKTTSSSTKKTEEVKTETPKAEKGETSTKTETSSSTSTI